MARRRSFTSIVNQMAREAARSQREVEANRHRQLREQERAQRQAEAERRRQLREQDRAAREATRLRALADKGAKQRYLEARLEEVEEKNKYLTERVGELTSILSQGLNQDLTISFESLRMKADFPHLQVPKDLDSARPVPDRTSFFKSVNTPGVVGRLLPGAGARHEKALLKAEEGYQKALRNHQDREKERLSKLNKLQEEYNNEHQAFLEKVEENNREVATFEHDYQEGDPDAVVSYNSIILERSQYPEGFPQEFRVAYVPEPRELVIDYELPTLDVIPIVSEYKYVKSKDLISEKPRKITEIRDLYQDIVASVCLRTIDEVFKADQGNWVELIVFNGFVQTVDPATGRDIRPYLISVRTSKASFSEIELSRVDKRACLRNLGAQVSPRPAEMQPVKPVIEFDMVDKRFVGQSDILGDLDSRPNLMELNPFEFENLVSNLFQEMGLETKQTRTNRDNGVDAIAFDPRPVLGGKVVIQAKRYKNVVGVSAVRDLYGTMMNEGANKGILVCTSHYGPDAYEFSKDKPIELIDGGGLLYLLRQAGVEARIIFPED